MKVEELLDDILRREGGYVNHPADRGGPTKYGITQETLSRYRKYPVTVDEVKALDEVTARQIYREVYVYPFKALHDDRLLALVVDSAVNHGVSRATKWLQDAMGVRADGIIGRMTEAAMAALSGPELDAVYRGFLRRRIKFYGALITSRPSQAVFAAGWMNRVSEFL